MLPPFWIPTAYATSVLTLYRGRKKYTARVTSSKEDDKTTNQKLKSEMDFLVTDSPGFAHLSIERLLTAHYSRNNCSMARPPPIDLQSRLELRGSSEAGGAHHSVVTFLCKHQEQVQDRVGALLFGLSRVIMAQKKISANPRRQLDNVLLLVQIVGDILLLTLSTPHLDLTTPPPDPDEGHAGSSNAGEIRMFLLSPALLPYCSCTSLTAARPTYAVSCILLRLEVGPSCLEAPPPPPPTTHPNSPSGFCPPSLQLTAITARYC